MSEQVSISRKLKGSRVAVCIYLCPAVTHCHRTLCLHYQPALTKDSRSRKTSTAKTRKRNQLDKKGDITKRHKKGTDLALIGEFIPVC